MWQVFWTFWKDRLEKGFHKSGMVLRVPRNLGFCGSEKRFQKFNVDYQLLISALLKTLFWKNSLNSYLFFFSYFNVAMITKPQFDFHIVCMMSISSNMTRTIRIKKRH